MSFVVDLFFFVFAAVTFRFSVWNCCCVNFWWLLVFSAFQQCQDNVCKWRLFIFWHIFRFLRGSNSNCTGLLIMHSMSCLGGCVFFPKYTVWWDDSITNHLARIFPVNYVIYWIGHGEKEYSYKLIKIDDTFDLGVTFFVKICFAPYFLYIQRFKKLSFWTANGFFF